MNFRFALLMMIAGLVMGATQAHASTGPKSVDDPNRAFNKAVKAKEVPLSCANTTATDRKTNEARQLATTKKSTSTNQQTTDTGGNK